MWRHAAVMGRAGANDTFRQKLPPNQEGNHKLNYADGIRKQSEGGRHYQQIMLL